MTAAKAVADRIPVRTVDSRSLTMGLGLIVLDAADMAAGGATLDELATRVDQLIARTKVFGALDTLEHLEKGGRIGGARALLGSLLSIKPVVSLVDGVVEEESKQRTRGRSLRYLADKAVDSQPISRLAVCNGAAADIDEFLAMLDGVRSEHPLVVTNLGPVVGTHTGPGTDRSVHDHVRLTGRRGHSGRPRWESDYPRTMDSEPESPPTRLPGSGAINDLPTRGTDLVDIAGRPSSATRRCDRSPWPPGPWCSGSSSSPPPWSPSCWCPISLIRLLTVYAFDGRVWLSDLVVGAVFVVVGLVAWSQRTDPGGARPRTRHDRVPPGGDRRIGAGRPHRGHLRLPSPTVPPGHRGGALVDQRPAGRPAHAHHRSGELSRVRRRHHGPRAHAGLPRAGGPVRRRVPDGQGLPGRPVQSPLRPVGR